ncbi:MAG: hypothetical protein ABI867_08155 [Kofleriaceae bacterium]
MIALPVGTMVESTRSIRVTLAHNARTRTRACEIVERLDGVAAEYFCIPTTIGDGDELALDYALDPGTTERFTAALPELRAEPAVHLPEIVEMARYLETAITYLEKVEVPAVIAPACLRYAQTGTRGAWRLLVVPLVDATLADWATSAPEAWQWMPSPVLFGKAQSPGAYAIGAALCAAISGDVFALHVCRGEQLRRALRGWVGGRARLEQAVRAALPASFRDEGDRLVELVCALLEPVPPSDWHAQLETLGEQLAPYRTAVRWEYEGKIDIARGILERMAATRPREHVPWEVVSRLRGREHDLAGALDAAISAVQSGDPEAVRELAAITRRIAHDQPHQRDLIELSMAAVDRLGMRLGDSGRLHFAHIEARYLERLDSAQRRLTDPMTDAWNNILRTVMLARTHAARDEWAHVAKLCKQAKATVQAMSVGGGQLGAYVVGYLDHLDGVAHCGAALQYADHGYLADAFAKLVASLDVAHRETDEPLVAANVTWLQRVSALAASMKLQDAAAIRTGIAACLAAYGLAGNSSQPGAIVWYDASRLLALSGVP